jgi:organic hydroperoxide reductase OsmC/OhrA
MSGFRFPVEIVWPGGKRVIASVPGKSSIEIATPQEFNGTHPDRWSPEDFLVAAVASCYAVTLVALAGRREIPLHALSINAEGAVGRRNNGPLGFDDVDLHVIAATDPGREDDLCKLAVRAEESCLVSAACRIPVRLTFVVDSATNVATSSEGGVP